MCTEIMYIYLLLEIIEDNGQYCKHYPYYAIHRILNLTKNLSFETLLSSQNIWHFFFWFEVDSSFRSEQYTAFL